MSARGKDARRLLWLIWAPCARPVCKKNLNILLALLFDSSLFSSTWTRSSLSDVLFVFIVASVPQSCQSFCQNTAGFFFFCCIYLINLHVLHCPSALVFAYSSQLPPSHPAAPPEHLKEPLAYMRKAQVSLSTLIFITPHLFFFYLCDSFCFACQIQSRRRIRNKVSEAQIFLPVCVCLCVCSLTQASWEKRVLKSLNSMSTELEVPLARMVAKILSITANVA